MARHRGRPRLRLPRSARHLGSGRRPLHQRRAQHARQRRLAESAPQRRSRPLDQAAADLLGDRRRASPVFGQNPWAARLPSALAVPAVHLARLAHGAAPWRRDSDRRRPRSCTPRCCSPFGAAQMHHAPTTCSRRASALAMWGFVRGALRRPAAQAVRWIAVMWVALRAGLPDQGAAGAAAAARRARLRPADAGRAARIACSSWSGIVLFALLALPWYVAVIARPSGAVRLFHRRRGGQPRHHQRVRPPRRVVRLARGLRADAAVRHAAVDADAVALGARVADVRSRAGAIPRTRAPSARRCCWRCGWCCRCWCSASSRSRLPLYLLPLFRAAFRLRAACSLP